MACRPMGTAEIECNLNKTVDFVVLVDVVGEPGGEDRGGVRALVLERADVSKARTTARSIVARNRSVLLSK